MEQQDSDGSVSSQRAYSRTATAIRGIRKRLGDTQHAFGRRLGYADTSANATISKLEAGTSRPTAEVIAGIFAADRVGAVELLTALAEDIGMNLTPVLKDSAE